jgi:hypothetical protein
LRRACGAVLGAVLLLCACAEQAPATLPVKNGEAVQADPPGSGSYTITAPAADTPALASSNFVSLYLDEKTMNILVRGSFGEDGASTLWSPLGLLPTSPAKGAAAAEITAVLNGSRVTLNTQDHSVSYGRATHESIKNGVRVVYNIFPNKTAAAKKTLEGNDIGFSLSMNYTLESGNLRVTADWASLTENPNAYIESVRVMERFGALNKPTATDFILLPDGSGALLYPAVAGGTAAEGSELRFPVYGEDVPVQQPSGTASVGAFGAKQGQAAFVAVIEQGAPAATVVARQSIPGEHLQAAVYAEFLITPTLLPGDIGAMEQDGGIRAAKGYAPADGEPGICLRYRFLFGDNANESTMANAIREELIGINLLSSTKTVDHPEGALPLSLTLYGEMGYPATTYDDARGILDSLERAGVAALNLRYNSAFSDDTSKPLQTEKLAPLRSLGGKDAFEALQEDCADRSYDLFPNVQLLALGKLSKKYGARNILGGVKEINSIPFRSVQTVPAALDALLKRVSKYGTAGIALGDIGQLLFSDYAGGGTARAQAARQIAQTLPPISAQWRVMLSGGYFHVVRTADVILDLPLSPLLSTEDTGRYRAFPLLPILLHGSADYAGKALNAQQDPEEAFLRSVAYGACPAIEWYANADPGERGKTENKFLLYTLQQQDAAMRYYERANQLLGDLRGVRILRHTKLTGIAGDTRGVTATEYANGVVIYVNYNETAIKTKEGMTITARSAQRAFA